MLPNIFLQFPRHPPQASHGNLAVFTTHTGEQPERILHLPLLALLTPVAQLERRHRDEMRIGYSSGIFGVCSIQQILQLRRGGSGDAESSQGLTQGARGQFLVSIGEERKGFFDFRLSGGADVVLLCERGLTGLLLFGRRRRSGDAAFWRLS